MSLPDLMTDEERIVSGFRLIDERTAKHICYGTWRYRCAECGLWARQVETTAGRQVCLKCVAEGVPEPLSVLK